MTPTAPWASSFQFGNCLMQQTTTIASPRSLGVLAALQAAYFLFTGLWPLVHLDSFLAVTGPKVDIWLVETVGVLVAAIGASLGLAAARGKVSAEIATAAMASAAGLATIDLIYVVRGRISPVYLLDVVAEGILIAAWVILSQARFRSATVN
jgi:hypothetical protein